MACELASMSINPNDGLRERKEGNDVDREIYQHPVGKLIDLSMMLE